MKDDHVERAPYGRREHFDGWTERLRAAFSRALLAEEQEIESLEEAVHRLHARHLELQEIFERAVAERALEPDSVSLPATVRLACGMPAREDSPLSEPARGEAADEKVLREARRFARLLVSEIVLYHGAEVEEGRRQGGLYARLKSPIERSRQAYEHRFGKSAAGPHHFFHEELLATLALDDAALLGAGYPGSLT